MPAPSACLLRAAHFALACACLLSVPLDAQTPVPANTFSQTFRNFAGNREYRAKSPDGTRWLDGGDRYTLFEPSAANPAQLDLIAHDTASDKREILIPAASFIPAGAAKPLVVEDYAWSSDKKQLLVYTNSRKVWRYNTRGDYWVLDIAGSKLTKLGGDAPESTLMFAKFSPDGRAVGFVREGNIYVQTLATGAIRQLTSDASDNIINGTTDWVTEEELDLRDAFRWSPDSQSIAYWQFDQSGVGEYTLINDTGTLYPKLFKYKYPQPGTTNSSVRVGVISAQGGATSWIKLPGDPRNNYIPRMEWVGDGGEIALEYLNRPQNLNQVYLAQARTGEARLLFEDKDAAWVDYVDQLDWLSASPASPKRDLLYLSERDGWRHAYLVSRATGLARLITNFPGDVIETVRIDQAGGFLYFMASPDDPIRTYLYRARLDGTGTPERVTPASQPGRHSYDLSPNGKWAIHTYSSTTVPPRFELVQLPTYAVSRTILTNDDLVQKFANLNLISAQEFTDTPIANGISLSTLVIKPPHFDPAKKYPVFVHVYGEPAALEVRDGWGSPMLSFYAARGYVVLAFDNQGTPAPRGRAWRKAGYGAIGVLSTQQQAEAIRAFAASHSYIDTTRMAIWGASGGGTNTLNMMFRNPGLYTTGISLAPVPDQAHYDTIYQERYMGIPAENARGYHDGAAINFAEGLSGNLLVLHGSGDDNVHFQGTELLVNRLIQLGKTFDFMDYPNRTHCLCEGPGTSVDVYSRVDRFLEEHVPPGPR